MEKSNFGSEKLPELYKFFKSQEDGLGQKEVEGLVKTFGKNEITKDSPSGFLRLFISQFDLLLNQILFISAVLLFALRDYNDGLVIFAALFVNIALGIYQKISISRAIFLLKNALRVKSLVIRDGHQREIDQEELVPGDIIIVKTGQKVPADARIIVSHDLRIDESILTGESLPKEKNAVELPKNTILSERENMLFMGTLVDSGSARALVVTTGDKTEIGKVAGMVKKIKTEKTPGEKQLDNLGRMITKIVFGLALIILIVSFLRGLEFAQIVGITVAVALAAVPEGLPAAITVILAISVQRLLDRNSLVRKLISVESLGAISIICTDKTGTLTEGKIQVAGIWGFADKLELPQIKDLEKRKSTSGQRFEMLALKIAALCSEAFIENPDDKPDSWILRGRPTEKALIYAAALAGIQPEKILQDEPQITKIPFNPAHKYSTSFNKLSETENTLYFMGAPELILEKSVIVNIEGKEKKLTVAEIEKLSKQYLKLSEQGYRVLAVGYKKTPAKMVSAIDGTLLAADNSLVSEMTFVALIALFDPLRPDLPKAISFCQKIGVRPIIVTGDNRLIAQSVAAKIGIEAKDENIIEGGQLDDHFQAGNEEWFDKISIFAKISPFQKSQIIEKYQGRGQIVAMIGDGINDTPAMKKANVGIAVAAGSDVAKETSEIVLLNNNFTTLTESIIEGRIALDNMRKVITYAISDNFVEIIIILLSLLAGWPLPLLGAQIIWINLVESGLVNMSFAFEFPHHDIVRSTPAENKTPILNSRTKRLVLTIGITTTVLVSALLFIINQTNYLDVGGNLSSLIFATISLNTLLFSFSCKSLNKPIWKINPFSNRYQLLAFFVGLGLLFAALYVGSLNLLLKTSPLNLHQWTIVLIVVAINLTLIELFKWLFTNRRG